MKLLVSLVGFGLLMLLFSLFPAEKAKALSPAVQYTTEQLTVCVPHPVSDTDSKDDKVYTSSRSVTAVSVVVAPEGRIFDPRPEATAFESWALHTGGSGSKPVATGRLLDTFVTEYRLTTRDSRSGSLRFARSIEAKNAMTAMSVLATKDCISALGLLDIENIRS